MKRFLLVAGITALIAVLFGPSPSRADRALPTPIQHVVVIYQENHSFDNVLGRLCKLDRRCDGATHGTLPDGSTIRLKRAADIAPQVRHDTTGQLAAIDGGKMDGFGTITGCTKPLHYVCYRQYRPSQIPNLAALARAFGVSDRTFSMDSVPSWQAHLELVAATRDGFVSDTFTGRVPPKPGWGCDSDKDAHWKSPNGTILAVPSCVPKKDGSGPYRPSPVQWVPTIMDRLAASSLSWRIYAWTNPNNPQTGTPYGWAICPTFADCLYTSQKANMVGRLQVLSDAAAGTLPNLSLVMPARTVSQHNGYSMLQGDDWIGQVVGAIEHGPDWASTAIFITYDDCGCFYDHVPPPAGSGLGIRVPMVIVSPYAKAGYTDSQTASFASMLAFTEHVFQLAALADADATAYDFMDAFDFAQHPLTPVPMTWTRIPAAERAYIARHPPPEDST
jgi:phospholipase C